MEVHVFVDMTLLVLRLQKLLSPLHTAPQLCDELRREDGRTNRIDLQRFAQVIKVQSFFAGELPQIGASPSLDAHQAFSREAVQGLSHWRLADAQLPG